MNNKYIDIIYLSTASKEELNNYLKERLDNNIKTKKKNNNLIKKLVRKK